MREDLKLNGETEGEGSYSVIDPREGKGREKLRGRKEVLLSYSD